MFGGRHAKQIIKADRSLSKEVKSMEDKVEILEEEITNVLTSSDSQQATTEEPEPEEQPEPETTDN